MTNNFIKEIQEKAANELLKYQDYYDHMQDMGIYRFGGDVINSLITHTALRTIEEVRKTIPIQSGSFAELIRFYQSNRGTGHTNASVKGVENTTNSVLLVANEAQKRNTGLPPHKQISLNGREIKMGGRRMAVVVDNFALQEMFNGVLSTLSHLEEDIKKNI